MELIERTDRYLLTGVTIEQLNRQLAEHARGSSARSTGLTRSHFELNKKLKPADDTCVVLELGMQIELTTILPDWQPEKPVSSELREEWARSVAILERHEEGHRQNVLLAGETLRKALLAMVPTTSCMLLDARMTVEFQSQLERLERIDASYDRRTLNGLRDDPRLGPGEMQVKTLRKQRHATANWSVFEMRR